MNSGEPDCQKGKTGSLFQRCVRWSLLAGAGVLLSGCSLIRSPVLDPQGPVALDERNLLLVSLAIMMIVAIPAIGLTLFFAWRYRSGANRPDYDPEWSRAPALEAAIFLVPAAIIVVLGTLVWVYTHRLDPYKELAAGREPFQVQAVALDWKWLFLYPELGTASVNELSFPADRPVSIEITSDTVMNALMIPALGGQIYAMAGMRTKLNLLANEPGTFDGRNTMYSGDGFPDQHFQAHALTDSEFEAWKAKVKASANALDARAYVALHEKSSANPVSYYSSFEPGLFDLILRKYAPITGPYESKAAEIICRGAA
nr:ubiquinol oxidase subunit II [Roseibium litorale]